jgi:hypothetical protein
MEKQMSECPRPDAHDAQIEFYGECSWCGAMETDRLVAGVDGTWMWVSADGVRCGDRIGKHTITAATRREDGRVTITFDDGKVVHEEVADWMLRVFRPVQVDGPRFPEIEVQLTGRDGNAFAVLGLVQRALRDNAVDDQAVSEFMDEATADSYDHLLRTAMRWVSIA